MNNIISEIIKKIVSHPDEVSVETADNTENINISIVNIKCHADDIPKIIGKMGITIKSITDLIYICQQNNSTGYNSRVILKVIS